MNIGGMSVNPPSTPSGRNTPRYSGIPTPGGSRSTSGIPTPGRPRISQPVGKADQDGEAMRALSDAIRANDPAQHRATPDIITPYNVASGRRSVTGKPVYNSRASTSSATSSGLDRSTLVRPKTPVSTNTSSFRSAQTPRSSISSRPTSRQSDVFRTSSRQAHISRALDLGDPVRIDSLDLEGTIQFLGEVDFREGLWAGVQLSPAYGGRGKNDGSVDGKRYFQCAPKCGVFVVPTKLTALNTRSDSVASMRDDRATPASNGRITPSFAPRQSYRSTAVSGPFKTPEPPKPGSRTNKYGDTARPGSISPTRTESRSPNRAATGLYATPKASSRPLASGLPGPTPRRSLGLGVITPKAGINRPRTHSPVPDLPTSNFLTHSPVRSRATFAKPLSPGSQASSETLAGDVTMTIDALSTEGLSLEANARAIQDRITRLIASSSRSSTESSGFHSPPLPVQTLALAPSPLPQDKSPTQIRMNEREAEIFSIKEFHPIDSKESPLILAEENAKLFARVGDLEALNKKTEALAKTEFEALSASLRSTETALESLRVEHIQKLNSSSEQVTQLKEALATLKTEKEKYAAEVAALEASKLAVDEDLAALQNTLVTTTKIFESEKNELTQEVDQLRLAGQETIALYEERLNNSEATRYDLEDMVKDLEEKLRKQAEPLSSAEITARATTAAQIDNETLHEQVTHLQLKISTLEDQLHDARAVSDTHEQAYAARMARFRESDAQLRKDIADRDAEKSDVMKAETAARARIDEVTVALQESDSALEDARAEIEALRSDLATLEAERGVDEDVSASSENSVARLRAQLEEERKRRADIASNNLELNHKLTSLATESEQLARRYQDSQAIAEEHQKRVTEMDRLLDQRTRELEGLRSSTLSTSSRESTSKTGRDTDTKETITGLKLLMQEKTKQNIMLESKNKSLSADIVHLTGEIAHLRESLERLEESFESKIAEADRSLHDIPVEQAGSPLLQDVATLRQALKDSQKRHEHELEVMRKKMVDNEQEHADERRALEHRVLDAEQMVEAKIWTEDELSLEVERLKAELRKASRGGSTRSKHRPSTAHSDTPIDGDLDRCEACGKYGHDIATCEEVFNAPLKRTNGGRTSTASSQDNEFPICEDCEGRHTTETCPFSQDVF